MKPLEYRFSLDMNDEAAQVFCNVRNGDDCSKLIVSLQEDGRAYTFDDDVHAYFLAKKSDGNSLYTECSVENNTIIYEFTEQTAPVSGTVVCQFLLLSASNRLTTPIFRLEVFDNVSIDPDSPQSLPEYTALIDATQDAIDATDDMRDLIEEIEYKLEHGEFKGDPGPQGPQGIQGPQGAQGIQGPTGADGYSPTATVTKSGNTATITITDKNGTTTAEIEDGAESVADVSPLGTSSSLIPNIDTATRSDVLYRVWADATSFENNDALGWIIFCGDLDFPTVKQFYFRYNALIMQRVGAVSNGVVSWGEWEATNNATVINDDTVPASVNWQGVIPNTYAGRTGQIGELALYADYSTFWYMADADPQNDYYEWYKVLNTDDLYSLMELAPLNPTSEQISAMLSGQLYGDTVNHKGIIKGGQSFYDTDYIDTSLAQKVGITEMVPYLHYVVAESSAPEEGTTYSLADRTPNSYSYVNLGWYGDSPSDVTGQAWVFTIIPRSTSSFGIQFCLKHTNKSLYMRRKGKVLGTESTYAWGEWSTFSDASLSVEGAFADAKAVGEALALKANTQDVRDALALKANIQDVAKSLKYAVVTIDPNVSAADRKLSDLENNTYSWVDSDDFSDAPVSDGSMGWIFTMRSPSSSYGMQLWISPKNLYCYSRRCAIQSDEVAWTEWYAMTDSTLTKVGVAADAKAVGDALALKANTQDVRDALALKANTQAVRDALALKANTQDVAKSLKYTEVTIDPNVDAADRKLSDLENNTYSWVDSDDFSDAPVSDGSMGWIFTMRSPSSSYGMQLWISPKNLYCYSRRCAIQSGEVAWTEWYAMTDSTLTKEGVAADAKAVGEALADIAVNYKSGAVYYSFGDSSTKGRIGTWDGSVSYSTKAYPNAVASMLHMRLKNQAVAGQGLIKEWGRAKANYGIIEMIADLDMSDASLITVGWAYNDDYAYGVYGNPANMGSYTDVTTVDVTDTEAVKALISYSSNGNPRTYGTSVIGYYYTIMKLLQTKCPNAQIVLVTGYGHPGGNNTQQINATLIDQFSHTFTFNDGVHTVKELYDELEKMAHLHGWCCVNQAKGCAFNEFNAPYFFGDFGHPTDEGYAKYGNNLAPRIASYYANRRI